MKEILSGSVAVLIGLYIVCNSLVSCTESDNKAIVALVNRGVDPTIASCTINTSNMSSDACKTAQILSQARKANQHEDSKPVP